MSDGDNGCGCVLIICGVTCVAVGVGAAFGLPWAIVAFGVCAVCVGMVLNLVT